MTKKDFELVARLIRVQVARAELLKDESSRMTLLDLANGFAAEFAQINLRFDHGRFLTACGF